MAPADVQQLLAAEPVRATALIVTIYGDVVVPRGGTLWMGSLIAACARFGISESLVRTAVSRLVASGQLEGAREGRRSYYRLAEAARIEFDLASRLFFDPQPPATGYLLRVGEPPGHNEPGIHYARLANGLHVRPRFMSEPAGDSALAFSIDPVSGVARMPDFAAALWDLESPHDAYRAVIDGFSPLARDPGAAGRLGDADALAIRLLLVHRYRRAVLKDPRLPDDALPDDWPGPEARRLFASLYLDLSPAADRAVSGSFESASGPLPASTPDTANRLDTLRKLLA